jgi:methionyl-tRNA formyltransferase
MRIVFIGTGEIGIPALRALLRSSEHQLVGVVTQPDKPVGRDQRIQPPPIKAELTGKNVLILQPTRIRNEAAIAEIRAVAPEIIIVMAYGQILPDSLLELPTLACLNLHASILPRHRGAAPIQAAIVAGERKTGITVIYMDEGLDTGDILLQKELEILPNDTGGTLHDRLAELAPAALFEALEQIAASNPPRIPQDSCNATYSPKLSREAGRVDWNEPAELIERKIRAFDPWPGAFTEVADAEGRVRKLKLFRAAMREDYTGKTAGTLLPNDSKLLVATGTSVLQLGEVQLEGKRRMSAADFLRGFSSPSLHF